MGYQGFGEVGGSQSGDAQSEARVIVLERCGALVRAYGARQEPWSVDKVLVKLIKARVTMDARFINSVMLAYIACREYTKAADLFFAATGISWEVYSPKGNVELKDRQVKRRAEIVAAKAIEARELALMEAENLDSTDAKARGEEVEGERAVASEAGFGSVVEYAGPGALTKDGSDVVETDFGALSSDPVSSEEGVVQVEVEVKKAGAAAVGSDVPSGVLSSEEEEKAEPAQSLSVISFVPKSCDPNVLLCTTLIKARGRQRRLDEAFRVLENLECWGLEPDVGVFNSLTAAAVWNDKMDMALELVQGTMDAWGVKPDTMSYNVLIDGYARLKEVENAFTMFSKMKAREDYSCFGFMFWLMSESDRFVHVYLSVYLCVCEYSQPFCSLLSLIFL
ncbi:unnamed protein product [Choristocarpus tenellus]